MNSRLLVYVGGISAALGMFAGAQALAFGGGAWKQLVASKSAAQVLKWNVQAAPSDGEVMSYSGLLKAAATSDLAAARALIKSGADVNQRDGHGRTPLMVAAYRQDHQMAELLMGAGADVNALDSQRYDVLTISGVVDDPKMVDLAIAAGANVGLTTSPYDGTALIASAHLGRVEVVKSLLKAGAPMDHVNNLGWTALIEAIVLGDGGERHTETLRALVNAGANVNLADRQGVTPLQLARRHGYQTMIEILENAGAR